MSGLQFWFGYVGSLAVGLLIGLAAHSFVFGALAILVLVIVWTYIFVRTELGGWHRR